MRIQNKSVLWVWMLSAAAVFSASMVSCQPKPGTASDASITMTAAVKSTPSEPDFPTASADISNLTIWLPPAYRPDSSSPGGNILQERINAYTQSHPGIGVSVRIKAAAGAGGLRDSLAAAAAAAPGALPDLVALDQSNLRAAAIKGLIHPLDALLPSGAWEEDYPFAKAMVVMDDLRYGLPFSGDAIVLASTIAPYTGPETWEQTTRWTKPVLLPLGDSRSLFLFFGYYAAGGKPITDIAGAEIDPDPLERTLAWLKTLQENRILSERSLQIDSFEGAFLAIENFGESSAALYSLISKTNDVFIANLPTPGGDRFTLATGWAWATAAADPARRVRAAELMVWLSDPEFLAEWSRAQGVLPTSRAALTLWNSSAQKSLAAGVLEKAAIFPDDEVSAFAGPVFSKAAWRVLLEGDQPAVSALEASQSI
jgi:ABC-type glycerol-3-phosphate transport system substrate-binding protein